MAGGDVFCFTSHTQMKLFVKFANTSWHTYEWAMCPARMSHVTCTNESCLAYEEPGGGLCGLSQLIIAHVPTRSHVTCINEWRHIYEWVMSHVWMSHVTFTNESCHKYEWVMSHVRMSHVTRTNESCHMYEWVMRHTWMSHVTYTNESCATHEEPGAGLCCLQTTQPSKPHSPPNHTALRHTRVSTSCIYVSLCLELVYICVSVSMYVSRPRVYMCLYVLSLCIYVSLCLCMCLDLVYMCVSVSRPCVYVCLCVYICV